MTLRFSVTRVFFRCGQLLKKRFGPNVLGDAHATHRKFGAKQRPEWERTPLRLPRAAQAAVTSHWMLRSQSQILRTP